MRRSSIIVFAAVASLGCDVKTLPTTLGPPEIPCDAALHGFWSLAGGEAATSPETVELILVEVRPASPLTCTVALRHGSMGDLELDAAGEAWLTELDGRRFLNLVRDVPLEEPAAGSKREIAVLELVGADVGLEVDLLAPPGEEVATPEAFREWIQARPRGELPLQQQYVVRPVPDGKARRLLRVRERLQKKQERAERGVLDAAWSR